MINELRKIKKRLIRQGFPELQTPSRPVYVTVKDLGYSGAETETSHLQYDLIRVDSSVASWSLDLKVGLMAHELAHCVLDRKKSINWAALVDVLYDDCMAITKHEEKLADRLAVQRGYGRQLLQLNDVLGEELGLFVQEIQRMIASGRYLSHSFTLL